MPHPEDRFERMVRKGLIYEGTNEIRRRVLATGISVDTGPVSLAAVG